MLKQPPSKPALNNSSVPTPLEPSLEALPKSSASTGNADPVKVKLPAEVAPVEENSPEATPIKKAFSKVKTLRKGGYIAIALALVSGGTAFAFTQVAPPSLQADVKAAIVPKRQAAIPPVSHPEDLEVQTFTSTRDLFLTNQIFYRKVEALAGAVATQDSATPADKSASDPKTADKNSVSAKASKTETKSKKKPEKAAQAQAEKVTASAPPAPAPEQIAFTGTTIDSVLEMRVAVAKDVKAIGFATSSNGTMTDLDGNVLKSLSPESASLASISGGLTVDGEPIAGGVFWIYPEDGGYVAIGDRWYRGRVLVALRERGLIAVNYVLLGDYLYSVVGSEMSPNWSIESLKAQAVAARSYALTHNIHPASEAYFDLDNTQRFQAYKGIGREANTTQAAVQSTAGEFISHEGGIVESLYAASQEIVDDAHKGSGMSQLGAKDLASRAIPMPKFWPTTIQALD